MFLHRPAEPSGQHFFTNLLAAGDSTTKIETIIVSSSEYFQVRANDSGAAFLDAVFSDALHRPADPGAKSAFGGMAFGDGSVRANLAGIVFGSDESFTQTVNFPQPHDNNPFADQVLHGFFQTFLGRDADPTGLSTFVKQFKSGVSQDQIVASILGSDEYFAQF